MFTPGAIVTFECNEGFYLQGDRRRICGLDGRWDIPEYGYTECLREYMFQLHITYAKVHCHFFFSIYLKMNIYHIIYYISMPMDLFLIFFFWKIFFWHKNC